MLQRELRAAHTGNVSGGAGLSYVIFIIIMLLFYAVYGGHIERKHLPHGCFTLAHFGLKMWHIISLPRN